MSAVSLLGAAGAVSAALSAPLLLLALSYVAWVGRGGVVGRVEWIVLQHVTVAIAVWPLALGSAWVLAVFAAELHDAAHHLLTEVWLPLGLREIIGHLGRVEADVTFLDVQVLACLLYVGYGLALVQSRMVDISRLLKISLRRLLRPDPETAKQLEAIHKEEQEAAARRLASAQRTTKK